MLKYGERRWRASVLAEGVETIPAFIDDTTDDYSQMIENIQREDLNIMEIAGWINTKIQNGEKGKHIAKRLGKTESYVSLHKKIIHLPEPVMALYASGVTQSARALADLKQAYEVDAVEVVRLCERVSKAGGITQEDLKIAIAISKGQEIKKTDDEAGESTGSAKAKSPSAKNLICLVRVKIIDSDREGVLIINRPSEDGKAWVTIEGEDTLISASTLNITSIEVI
ncbi:MAG: ParB/RepB/Spo0J family partition protein [Gammaproteobacteria bacterium]|nr:ParB/RepB/Spo0J family partition protein [Gammaproteobacteria bacterium]